MLMMGMAADDLCSPAGLIRRQTAASQSRSCCRDLFYRPSAAAASSTSFFMSAFFGVAVRFSAIV